MVRRLDAGLPDTGGGTGCNMSGHAGRSGTMRLAVTRIGDRS